MSFFTIEEFNKKYNNNLSPNDDWKIEAVCEMIYSQVGLRYRNKNWTKDTVPVVIKNASMEQLRFMLEYDIPLIDYKGNVKAGAMSSELKSDYSTLALRMLANAGLMYRGNPSAQNMGLTLPWGD